jgi:dTDP-L-rhamnose 4-epimerase
VSDVARANLLALEAPPEVEGALNIASGSPHTILDLATELWSSLGCRAPEPEVTAAWRLGDVRHIQASPALAASVLGFEAATSFSDGISELL